MMSRFLPSPAIAGVMSPNPMVVEVMKLTRHFTNHIIAEKILEPNKKINMEINC